MRVEQLPWFLEELWPVRFLTEHWFWIMTCVLPLAAVTAWLLVLGRALRQDGPRSVALVAALPPCLVAYDLLTWILGYLSYRFLTMGDGGGFQDVPLFASFLAATPSHAALDS